MLIQMVYSNTAVIKNIALQFARRQENGRIRRNNLNEQQQEAALQQCRKQQCVASS